MMTVTEFLKQFTNTDRIDNSANERLHEQRQLEEEQERES